MSQSMMDSLLAMMPPEVAASAKVIGTLIPQLGNDVIAGRLTPEEAAAKLGEEMIPTFQAMKDNA